MEAAYKPIILEETFDVSIEKLWKALSILEEMKQWYFPNIPSFETIKGFETRFDVHSDERTFPHHWKVTEVIPMKLLAYEWQFDGYPGTGVSTFELSESVGGSKLNFKFDVLERFPNDIPEFKRESGVAGWDYFLRGRLKEYLKKV